MPPSAPALGRARRLAWGGSSLAVAGALAAGCGSRSSSLPELVGRQIDAAPQPSICLSDTDCDTGDLCAPGSCLDGECTVRVVSCDDGEECTADTCDSSTGACRFEPLTPDADGDGHRRPLPGFLPGEVGACGDDCNDTSPLAFPGGTERCDGVDNDCDGVVDNGALFSPSPAEPVLLSEGASRGTAAGLSFAGGASVYGAIYNAAAVNTFVRIELGGGVLGGGPVSDINSNTFAGTVLWTGSVFATAWEDRRDEDYEVYFNRFAAGGRKLGPDRRITAARGFSLRPSVIFDGGYTLAWEDHRDRGRARIFAQRLSEAGEPIGGNVPMTRAGLDTTGPVLALGDRRVAMVFSAGGVQERWVGFQSFNSDLSEPSGIVQLPASNTAGASIVYNGQGRFVVGWHTEDPAPGPAIYAAVMSAGGELLVEPRAVTEPAAFARYHTILPLGDRLLLLWSEWAEGRYNIRSRELSAELEPLGEAVVVTDFASDAYGPVAALGDDEIGVLFTAFPESGGPQQVFFTRMSCDQPMDGFL